MLEIEVAYCKGCALCLSVCPRHILARSQQFNRYGYYTAVVVDAQACTGCGLCVLICPDAAIELRHDAALPDSSGPGRDDA